MKYNEIPIEDVRERLKEIRILPKPNKFIYLKKIEHIHKTILDNIKKSSDSQLNLLANWVIKEKDIIALYQVPEKSELQVTSLDFSFMANIEILKTNKAYLDNHHIFICLNNIITIKDGCSIGKNFINRLISWSREDNMPIRLICKDELIPYYKNLGFFQHGYFDGLNGMYFIP